MSRVKNQTPASDPGDHSDSGVEETERFTGRGDADNTVEDFTKAIEKHREELLKTDLPTWCLSKDCGIRIGLRYQAELPPLRKPLRRPSATGSVSTPSANHGSGGDSNNRGTPSNVTQRSQDAMTDAASDDSEDSEPIPITRWDPPCYGPHMAGYQLWNPTKVEPKVLSKILHLARTNFEEELAPIVAPDPARYMYLLHRLYYDGDEAVNLIKPPRPPVEEDTSDPADAFPGDDLCFICRDGGNILLCENPGCFKVYHPECLKLDKLPAGTWHCPLHFCNACRAFLGPIRGQGTYSVHRPPGHYTLRPNGDPMAAPESEGLLPPPPPSVNRGKEPQIGSCAPYLSEPCAPAPACYCATCPTSFCRAHVPSRLHDRQLGLGVNEFMCGRCLDKEQGGQPRSRVTGAQAFSLRLAVLQGRLGIPILQKIVYGKAEINLYTLYLEVIRQGGIAAMLKNGSWAHVKTALKIPVTAADTHPNTPAGQNPAALSAANESTGFLLDLYVNQLYAYERRHFPGSLPLQPEDLENRKPIEVAPPPPETAVSNSNPPRPPTTVAAGAKSKGGKDKDKEKEEEKTPSTGKGKKLASSTSSADKAAATPGGTPAAAGRAPNAGGKKSSGAAAKGGKSSGAKGAAAASAVATPATAAASTTQAGSAKGKGGKGAASASTAAPTSPASPATPAKGANKKKAATPKGASTATAAAAGKQAPTTTSSAGKSGKTKAQCRTQAKSHPQSRTEEYDSEATEDEATVDEEEEGEAVIDDEETVDEEEEVVSTPKRSSNPASSIPSSSSAQHPDAIESTVAESVPDSMGTVEPPEQADQAEQTEVEEHGDEASEPQESLFGIRSRAATGDAKEGTGNEPKRVCVAQTREPDTATETDGTMTAGVTEGAELSHIGESGAEPVTESIKPDETAGVENPVSEATSME